MTRNSAAAQALAIELVPESGRFDQISIALHWLTVLLVLGQFTSAWLREAIDHNASLAAAILATHRGTGLLTWVVGLVRLFWRHTFAYLPPFPPGMPRLQQWIAKANEYSLYGLLFIQPMTGLGGVLFRGQPFEVFVWEVPALLEPNDAPHHFLAQAHEFGAKALLLLIALHAGAAFYHRLFLRDGVMQRMLPWVSE